MKLNGPWIRDQGVVYATNIPIFYSFVAPELGIFFGSTLRIRIALMTQHKQDDTGRRSVGLSVMEKERQTCRWTRTMVS